jgi:1,4-alpha-glucan branching enzyme
LYLFNTGQLFQAYRTFGAHPAVADGQAGVRFAVWAPNAKAVAVVGDFNGWNGTVHPLQAAGSTGVWIGFVAGLRTGERYKYELLDANGSLRLKADPFGFQSELRPNTASVVSNLDDYEWQDAAWMEYKRRNPPYGRPMLTYEAHLGSWRTDGPEMFRTYEQLAEELVDYIETMGYTHIELLPLTSILSIAHGVIRRPGTTRQRAVTARPKV